MVFNTDYGFCSPSRFAIGKTIARTGGRRGMLIDRARNLKDREELSTSRIFLGKRAGNNVFRRRQRLTLFMMGVTHLLLQESTCVPFPASFASK